MSDGQGDEFDIGGDIRHDKWDAFVKKVENDRRVRIIESGSDSEHEPFNREAQENGVDIEFDNQDCEDEAQQPKSISDPGDPTPEQIQQHHLAHHLPFRSWCECCVLAKAKDNPHRQASKDKTKEGVPIVGLDFCHPGEEEDGEDKMDILVIKDFISRA